jgi:putative tryptophan/tyrosine transport system substrate-binding protein
VHEWRREPQGRDRLRGAIAPWVFLMLLSAAPALALEKPVRIGVLTAAWGPPGALGGLVEGLIDLGYRENEDFVIGVRFTQGDIAALPAAAKAMVEGGVDVLLADSEPAVKAVQEATSTHPIVFLGVGDPIGRGLITSYNRPGGNATGVANLELEVSGRRLQLFKDLVPGLKRVLLPYDKHNNYDAAQVELYRTAAQRLRVELVERQLETEEGARAALAEVRKGDIDGMLAPQEVSLNIPGWVLESARKEGIPAMFASSVYLAGGGIASYGGSRDAAGKQAARLVDKIIKGAVPGELPVETVQSLEFVINLKTADELGVVVPREVLFQADRIIR